MTTAVPTIDFTANGPVAPSQPLILVGVTADYVTAFGSNLNTDPRTRAGQLITTETAIIGDNYDKQVFLYNQFNPAFAVGRALDAVSNIYFLTRIPAQATVVTGVCLGAPRTVIPQFAQIADTNGNTYAATGPGTIANNGTIAIPFQCTVSGPIVCPSDAIESTPQTTIPGWDSVSNPDAGVTGSNAETDYAFRQRRNASVQLNSVSQDDAILGAVLAVPNVIDAYVVSNRSASPATIGGVSIAANTLYVGVSGGVAQAVGNAIYSKAPPGIPTQGATSVTVTDPNPLYSSPPTYTINFQALANLEIYFQVTITNSTAVPANALALIQAAIQTAFNGADGGPRARTGTTIYALRFYNGVAAVGAWAQVVSLSIGSHNLVGAVIATSTIVGFALTVGSVSSGTVAIGQFVTGAGVADGTFIVSGSGTSWVVNNSQAVGSETMTLIAPTLPDLTVTIAQEPVLDVANIQLRLI